MAELAEVFPPDIPPSSADVVEEFADDVKLGGTGESQSAELEGLRADEGCGPPNGVGFQM